jgi:pheromone shutdown protein TraB
LNKAITWKERFCFIKDIIKALFGFKDPLVKKFDISSVPEDELIDKLIKEVKKRYPNIYRVLIYERNKVISKKLFSLMQKNKKIVAVLGAGHKKDVIEIIKDREIVYFAQNKQESPNL